MANVFQSNCLLNNNKHFGSTYNHFLNLALFCNAIIYQINEQATLAKNPSRSQSMYYYLNNTSRCLYCTRIEAKGQIKITINKETPFSALKYLYPFKIKENVAVVLKKDKFDMIKCNYRRRKMLGMIQRTERLIEPTSHRVIIRCQTVSRHHDRQSQNQRGSRSKDGKNNNGRYHAQQALNYHCF